MDPLHEPRVGHRILRHIRALEFPRFTGTSGEYSAQAYIRGVLQTLRYRVTEQEFTSSLFPFEVLPRLGVALVTGLLVGAFAAIEAIPVLSIELALLALLLLVAMTRWSPLFERMYRFRKFGRVRSRNLIARHPMREGRMNVVFTAHYDSKSQWLNGSLRVAAFGAMALLAAAAAVTAIVTASAGWPGEWMLVPLLPAAALAALLQANGTSNASPGAYDNASGVGVLLEIAAAYADEAPGCNVAFIATGAEEAGLCGAVTLAGSDWFRRQFPPNRTVLVNLDGIGSKGPLRVTDRYGVPPTNTGAQLSQLCLNIADRFGIEARRSWMPGGAGLDHIPFAVHGYESVTLSTAGWNRAFRSMHTKNDVAEHLHTASLEHCYAVCLEILDSIPRAQVRAADPSSHA